MIKFGFGDYKESSVLILSIIIIFLVAFLSFSSITLVSPYGGTVDRSPVFEWMGDYDSYRILIDDDSSFESPLIDVGFEEEYFSLGEDLEFGEYYWKLIAFEDGKVVESKPLKFEIVSLVSYSIDENDLVSEGNVRSDLDSITGGVVLDPGQRTRLLEENYTLSQNG